MRDSLSYRHLSFKGKVFVKCIFQYIVKNHYSFINGQASETNFTNNILFSSYITPEQISTSLIFAITFSIIVSTFTEEN